MSAALLFLAPLDSAAAPSLPTLTDATPRRPWRAWMGAGLLALASLAGGFAHAQTSSLLGGPAEKRVSESEQVRAELMVHAPEGATPGSTVWVGLQLTHAPHWHTYWKNPGDSGLPTEIQWTLPEGVTAGEVAWPTPRKFPLGPLANYGYDGTVLLPVPLTIAANAPKDRIEVGVYATWLACRKECIPEEANLKLSLPVATSTALNSPEFTRALDARPTDAPAKASTIVPGDGFIEVTSADLPKAWEGKTLEFFPETPGLIEPGAAWQQFWREGQWVAKIPLSPQRFESPTDMAVVVAVANPPGEGPGEAGARVVMPVKGPWPAAAQAPGEIPDALKAALEENASRAKTSTPATVQAPAAAGAGASLWVALLGALLGGLALNLMPCVFPVLAIKVLAFAKHAEDHRTHRLSGLAYTAGVVLSFLALGGLLLALRSAGEAVGWGFQLQNPVVVAALAALFTVIGLNLSGLFEFGQMAPGRLAAMQLRHPAADAFLTGVLAVAVASPCTAPFMGASLGLAVSLPAWQGLAFFGALGFGLALPYLLASWVPAFARLLPKPGAWMNTFRQLLAFPMFATVVWLVWVLGQQTGVDGAGALLMLLVGLAFVLWAVAGSARPRSLWAVISLGAMGWLAWSVGPYVTRMPTAEATAQHETETAVIGLNWQAWTPERQQALLAEGRPVLVDFTAAWCVTCQYNKRTTLNDESLLGDLARANVALLRADWTRRDPAITEELNRLGRSGVPTYAVHRQGSAPVVLSELISADEVRQALQR